MAMQQSFSVHFILMREWLDALGTKTETLR